MAPEPVADPTRPIVASVSALLDVVGEPVGRQHVRKKLVALFVVAAALLVDDILDRGQDVDAIDPVAWLWGQRLEEMMREIMAHARACRREDEEPT